MSTTQPLDSASDIFLPVTDGQQPPDAALPTLHHESVTRLFNALREVVRPEAPGFGRPFTRGEVFRGQLESHWANAKVVSFDIFDTVIVRKVQAPRDVFLFLADYAPFKNVGTAVHVAQLRYDAEMIARRRTYLVTGSGEATLTEIHAELAKLANIDVALVPEMVAAERDIELGLCIAHPYLRHVYQRARKAGKIVWFVSDTYHDAAFLRELLANAGYNDANDRIVSSCDERCSKGSGKLLPKLVLQAGLAQHEFVHVGDNLNSDCALPSQAGINGVWHPLAGAPEGAPPSPSREHALAAGLASWGLRTFEPPRPFWWRFGFGVAGPLLVGFAGWLHQQMRADGVTKAFFLLRDGDVLKRVYDVMHEGQADAIPSALLESSRRAYMLPALGPTAPSLTTQLFVSENPRPVGEFLTRLRIRIDDLGPAFVQAGFTGPDEIVGSDQAGRLAALFSNPKVTDRIIKRSAEERAVLMGYLKQEQVIGHKRRVALVDIGWNATIQKSLDHAAKVAGVPADVVGYYIGTTPGASNDAISPMRGYLFELGAPGERARMMLEFRQLTEFICTSARGSLLQFAQEGKRIVPVIAEPDHDEGQMEAILALHEGALDYARMARDETNAFGMNPLDADAAAHALFRVISNPTGEEAETIGAVTHGDGMGAVTSRAFARFEPGAFTPDSVLKDYGRSYWKAGMLNQQSAQALMLRTLLWLHDR
jgi:FMN phosphatase YigB (HAD superfamily)